MQSDPEQNRRTDAAAEDLYGLLGVAPDVSPGELKRAWHRLATQYHPDARHRRDAPVATGTGTQPVATSDSREADERFLHLNRAYAILSDPARRLAYDDELTARQRADSMPREVTPGALCRKRGSRFPRQHAALQQLANALPIAATVNRLSALVRRWRRLVLAHPLLRLLRARTLPWMQYLASLPWASLVRVRALGAAFVCGLLVLWVSYPGQTPAPLLDGQTVTAGKASPRSYDADGTLRGLPEADSGRTKKRSSNARKRNSYAAENHAAPSPAFALSGEGVTTSTGRLPGVTHAVAENVAPLESDAQLAPETNSVRVDMADLAPQAVPKMLLYPPVLTKQERGVPAVPRTQVRGPAPRESRWLAGCRSADGRIWRGQLGGSHNSGTFSWRAIGKDATEFRAIVDIEQASDSVGRAGEVASSSIAASATRFLASGRHISRFELGAATLPEAPCRTWAVTSRNMIGWLAGKWISAERPQAGNGPDIRPKYLQLLLKPGRDEIVGNFRGLYTIRSGAAGLSVTRSATILPAVEFQIRGDVGDFNGSLHWQQPDYGNGILTVVPLSETSLAIYWKAERLVPGRLQLSGGTGVLYRPPGQ